MALARVARGHLPETELLSVLARVAAREHDGARLLLALDDGSTARPVVAVYWLPPAAPADSIAPVGTYVTAVGRASAWDPLAEAGALDLVHVGPLTDFNHVTRHLLEVVWTHLRAALPSPPPPRA